jgi:enoyl-[acyl-carrier protein] reductase / trans-2-enoyl-CoA reductase (NAD+)
MIIQPKIRGFICTAAHPAGCAESVKEQIQFVQDQSSFNGPKKVLIIGSSTGYGLASRIALAFGASAQTIGVAYEKPAQGKRTASAGWYNTAAFEQQAHAHDLYAKSINGDAFSNEIKQQVVDLIKADFGQIDCLVYSLASPRRIHPDTGESFTSVLKPIGDSYTNLTIDPLKGNMSEISIEPASQDEIDNTVTVMGGDDWSRWVSFLRDNDLLADNFSTVAYSYIGPEMTFPIYTNGSIGQAKKHLQETADKLHQELSTIGGSAYISVNKALVTQSSSAIPVVPLYMSILFKVMQANNTNERCIQQMYRLFAQHWYGKSLGSLDEHRRFRLDDLEMDPSVQQEVADIWSRINADNVEELADLKAYQTDFYRLFGFGFENIDYFQDVDADVMIPSMAVSVDGDS